VLTIRVRHTIDKTLLSGGGEPQQLFCSWPVDCPPVVRGLSANLLFVGCSSRVLRFMSMSHFDQSSLEFLVGRGLPDSQPGGVGLSAPCRLAEVLARTIRVGAIIGCRLWRFCSNLWTIRRIGLDRPPGSRTVYQALADRPPWVCQIWLSPLLLE
jgi:hypothetical protein